MYINYNLLFFFTDFQSANGLGIWYTAMRNRSNMRQDNKTDMTFCKILFSLTPNELVDSEQDLTVVSIFKKLHIYVV